MITFSELVSHLMPRDYTRKPWTIARDEENDRLEKKRLAKTIVENPFASPGLKDHYRKYYVPDHGAPTSPM